MREAVRKLKRGKGARICNTSAEILKAKGEAMIRELHAKLFAVWQSGSIPLNLKRGVVDSIWEGKRGRQNSYCNSYRGNGITLLSVPEKVLAHVLLMRI